MSDANDRYRLFSYSYSRGIAIFLYGLIWLGLSLGGFLLLGQFLVPGNSIEINLAFASVAALLAGSVGGATALLDRLARQVAIDCNFDKQKLLFYWVQPPLGAFIGFMSLLLVAIPGSLIATLAAAGPVLSPSSFATPTFTALQLVIAWTAGFYQQQGIHWIKMMRVGSSPVATPQTQKIITDSMAYQAWYHYRVQMIRWSYTWGLAIFFYGLVWFVFSLIGWLVFDRSGPNGSTNSVMAVIISAWPAVIAGGIGGVVRGLNDLYRSVSYRQDFDRQRLMWYLVQPPVGAVLGAVIYMLIASGYLSIHRLFSSQQAPALVNNPSIFLTQLALAWLAGFQQNILKDLILKFVADIVAFARTAAGLLAPSIWFKKEERAKKWAELGRKTRVFKPAEGGHTSGHSA